VSVKVVAAVVPPLEAVTVTVEFPVGVPLDPPPPPPDEPPQLAIKTIPKTINAKTAVAWRVLFLGAKRNTAAQKIKSMASVGPSKCCEVPASNGAL
jgi:hypothetical protein